MQIAAYVRVSTDDQNEDRQMHAIREKYPDPAQNNEIDWFCDLGESGASTSRREYQQLREHVAEYDVVVAPADSTPVAGSGAQQSHSTGLTNTVAGAPSGTPRKVA